MHRVGNSTRNFFKGELCKCGCFFSHSFMHLFSTKPARNQSMEWWILLYIIYMLGCVCLCRLICHNQEIMDYEAVRNCLTRVKKNLAQFLFKAILF